MKFFKTSFLCLITLIFILNTHLPVQAAEEKKPLTVAESSGFKATSKHSDVLAFIQKLQTLTPNIRVETVCTSAEGKRVPLIILGNPVPSSPVDLRLSEKPAVYIQANIHAGEVEGKEASLMLARDILLGDKSFYLDDLVVLITPDFNPDGNDKISKENRTRQAGPEEGVGIRYNGLNQDLNRDGLKLESPEVRGLVKNVLMRWDPVLLIDCHTHNGSYHEEPVTYVWNQNPNGDADILAYMRDIFFPDLQKTLLEKYDLLTVPHGDFMDPRNPGKGWVSSGAQPRYITNYVGLRNRMALLNENYPYVDFKTRVLGCYKFLCGCLDHYARNKDKIMELVRAADLKTIRRGANPTEKDTFAVTYELKPLKDNITIKGYVMKVQERQNMWPRVIKTDTKKTYHLPYFADYIPEKTVRFPYAYLIPVPVPEIKKKLLQHGILVEELVKPAKVEVESFQIKKVKAAERAYQGHYRNKVEGEYSVVKKEFPAGTLFIGTAQRLANVAAYLLEPESDDGLLVWNYFDRYIVSQWGQRVNDYPVYKVYKRVSLVKETIK